MSIKISPKIKAFKEYFKRLDGDLQKDFLARVVEETRENARERASKHTITGRLERNIDSKVNKIAMTGEVFVANQGMLKKWKGKNVNYGIFVHFPTKPHPITPKKWKALRWEKDGKFIFAKKVKHPGYKGDPFLYKGLADTFKQLDRIFEETTKGL